MKYRDTVLALVLEMWRPLDFCSLRSGSEKMVTILAFGIWLHRAPGKNAAFCWMIIRKRSQNLAQGAKGFHEKGSSRSLAG